MGFYPDTIWDTVSENFKENLYFMDINYKLEHFDRNRNSSFSKI